jgi:hypothetical protein
MENAKFLAAIVKAFDAFRDAVDFAMVLLQSGLGCTSAMMI